ncbi:hypothetical protein GF314_17190 [bacterium]|nr:hypothetical protein [bacterium]
MARMIVLVSTVLALLAGSAAAERFTTADGCDVREVRWGMSMSEVRRVETGEPTEIGGTLLLYPTTVNDQPCTVSYLFDRGRLCMAFYQFSDIFEEPALYFDEVAHVRDELSAAHGAPHIDKWHWEDPMFAEDPSLKADALGLGLVQYELGWMTDRSIVALRMAGGNRQADILVMYADRRCFPSGQEAFGDFFASAIGLPSPYYRQ